MRSYPALKTMPLYVCCCSLLLVGCAQKHLVEVHEDVIILSSTFPQAEEVLFASSIDEFQYHRVEKGPDGAWEVQIPKHEEFQYFYRVDGKITLPDCLMKIPDDFGSKNCFFSSVL